MQTAMQLTGHTDPTVHLGYVKNVHVEVPTAALPSTCPTAVGNSGSATEKSDA